MSIIPCPKNRDIKLSLFVLAKRMSKIEQYFLIVLNKTFTQLTLVGYEMIIANSAPLEKTVCINLVPRVSPFHVPGKEVEFRKLC